MVWSSESSPVWTQLTVHHVAQFQEHSLLTPLAVDQFAEFLGRLVCLSRAPEDPHHHQHKVLQSHGQQNLDAFVAARRRPAGRHRNISLNGFIKNNLKNDSD